MRQQIKRGWLDVQSFLHGFGSVLCLTGAAQGTSLITVEYLQDSRQPMAQDFQKVGGDLFKALQQYATDNKLADPAAMHEQLTLPGM